MSKFKFINTVDTIFLAFVILFVCFAWIQFFIKNIILSLFISLILSFGIILTLNYFKSKKYKNTQSILKRDYDFSCFRVAIQTMSVLKLTSTIKKIIPHKYCPKSIKGDIHFIKNGESYILTFYYIDELKHNSLLNIVKNKICDNLIVFCSSYTQEAKSISGVFTNKSIELIDLEQLFEILNSKNVLIDTSNINLEKPKKTIKQILKNIISRDKSKSYFIGGIVLLFTSLIIPYKIYYILFSSALFILSVICRLKPYSKPNTSIFE